MDSSAYGPTYPSLANHPTQSSAPIDGWHAVVFGLPFSAAGGTIIAVALGAVDAGRNAPAWLIGLIGALFFFAGAFFILHGIRGVLRSAKYRRDAEQRPEQPWMYDYPWSRESVTFSTFNEMLHRLMGMLLWYGILTPFFWIGLRADGSVIFLYVAVFFALIGLVFVYRWVQMLAEGFRYGNTTLQFDTFPYSLGGTLTARLHVKRHLGVIEALTITFRCVEERYITSGHGESRSTSIVCYERYKEEKRLGIGQFAESPDGISLEFAIPADQPTTMLATRPPTYWEIEVRGRARGADLEAYFLVPVYKTTGVTTPVAARA